MTDRRWYAELSPDAKRFLLEQLLSERAGRPKTYPASFSQQRLWFFEQMEPGSPVYNNCVTLDLFGRLNPEALGQSLNDVIRRHESMRTTFQVQGETPVQVVSPALNLPVAFEDLRSVPPSARPSMLDRLLLEESLSPFDLEHGPLVRARIVQVEDEHHVLAITIHHIVSDGWSIIVVLLRELFTFYGEIVAGRSASLPPLPLQYGEFAVWQRDVLKGERLDAALSFWRSTLGSAPEPLLLPTDRPRPKVQTFRGRSRSIVLERSVSDALQRLGREHNATLFMALLATFGSLLARLSGQDRVLVGSPITGRTLSEAEGLVGFFVNTLPLPVELGGDPSFEQLLRSVGHMARQAYAHQDLPFDRIVEELNPHRDMSRTPLFQVMLNMLGFATEASSGLSDLRVVLRTAPMATSKFDLTVYATPQKGGLSFLLVYNADLFDDVRMTELLDQYTLLLEQSVARPHLPLSQHTLVSARARPLLPDATAPLAGDDQPNLLTRLSRVAGETPRRPALNSSKEEWSYALLEARVNRLAGALARSGLGRGDVVAIWARRDPMLVCGMLGILKAGAALTILDPTYPAARLAACWHAAVPKGLLIVEGTPQIPAALWEEVSALPLLVQRELSTATIDDDLATLPTGAPAVPTDADTPAYVAFTSGTTGGVKAILGTHGPLVHFLDWHARTHDLGPDDRFSMLSGLSHDPLLRDVFAPLWVGASLHVPDPERIAEPGWLAEWMTREAITVAHLTPAMSHLLTTGPTEGRLDRLRRAFFGGEMLTKGTVARFREVAPAATCVNFYGATETPQAMGYYVVPQTIPDGAANALPIGRGIDDVQLLVTNRHGGLAGVGELGEVVVRTPYLTRGYLGDEALTRQRFVVNPATGNAADRVYRTGDLGRYGLDGEVEFAGRADTQVKLRGFRIELGEIEMTLREHPAVKDVVVLAVREGGDDQGGAEDRLVAYLVHGAEVPPTVTELRRFVRERLPDYMAPSSFAVLDALPLTPNGKVDRRTLAELSREQAGDGEACVPPHTEMEKFVAEVWRELLGIRSVGVRDNFFDLGGHSLLAVAAINRIEMRVGRRVSLREMTYQTLEQFASSLEAAGRPSPEPGPTATPTFAGRLRGLLRRRGVGSDRRST